MLTPIRPIGHLSRGKGVAGREKNFVFFKCALLWRIKFISKIKEYNPFKLLNFNFFNLFLKRKIEQENLVHEKKFKHKQ
jgi:hypothetical protein